MTLMRKDHLGFRVRWSAPEMVADTHPLAAIVGKVSVASKCNVLIDLSLVVYERQFLRKANLH
eukprot:4449446-Amphidinium_carterae.1